MGQRDLKCLMITGAMAVVNWAVRRDETTDPWLDREARGCAIQRSWTRRPIRRRCKEGTLVEVMQHRWCSPIPDGILAR